MRPTRQFRRILLFLSLYFAFCLIAGIFVADGTLHPTRRPLTPEEETAMRDIANKLDSDLEDVSILTPTPSRFVPGTSILTTATATL